MQPIQDIFPLLGQLKKVVITTHQKPDADAMGSSLALYNFLKGKSCSVFPSDIRVHNILNGLYTYPDVTILCGKEEYLDDQFDTLLNPTVIFEVLSGSTEDYDRGTKFKLYRSIPSLQNYVLVSSTELLAEVYTRSGDSWILTTSKTKEEHIHISAIGYDLALADVYAQVSELTR